jgi:3-mercaptopyruvate sulfurtransferase SseA
LLERKHNLVNNCRILDVRDSQEYSANHIPNAVSVTFKESLQSRPFTKRRTEALLQELGILKNMQVVIYDQAGGLDAAWLWWNLLQAGHPYVAVLDGGWRNWLALGFPVSEGVPKNNRMSYHPQETKLDGTTKTTAISATNIRWNWEETVGPEGLKNAEAVGQSLHQSGLRGPGSYRLKCSPKEAAYLIFLLKLFGRSGHLQEVQNDHCLLRIDPEN